MAIHEYVPKAITRPQIDKFEFSGSYVAGNTITTEIGNSQLVVTLGTAQTALADIAQVIVQAINAYTLHSNVVGTEQRSAAGQLLPEFRDVEAIVDANNTSRILVYSRVAGVPFGKPNVGAFLNPMTMVGSGGGFTARVVIQDASGPWNYADAANWVNGVPATAGTIYCRYGQGPKYNLPGSGIPSIQPAAIIIDQSVDEDFHFGLPDWNPLGYREYRGVAAVWNNHYSNFTNYTIGRGVGKGPRLMRFTHADTGTDDLLQAKGIIYNTGTPQPGSGMSHCFYLNAGDTQNTGDLKILGGHVALAPHRGDLMGFGTTSSLGIETGNSSVPLNLLVGEGVNLNDRMVTISGGTVEIRGDIKDVSSSVSLLKVAGRRTRVNIVGNGSAGSPRIDRLNIRKEAVVSVLSEMTIGKELIVEGTLDLRHGSGNITVAPGATVQVRSDGLIDDPSCRLMCSQFASTFGGITTGA